jgi:RNA polymerase sigma-70 factor (ECF subfamily)
MNADDDSHLISLAKDGDIAAFERLYRLHSARVHGLCTRLCDNHADAQDATQQTFVKAWGALSRFQGNSAFSTWLHRIAFNESMNLRRSRGNREQHLELIDPEGRDNSAHLTEMEQLERAVSMLPERAREALVLHKIYGYTHEETAEFMGTSVGASKAHVHRAMKQLRGSLPLPTGTGIEPGSAAAAGGALGDE